MKINLSKLGEDFEQVVKKAIDDYQPFVDTGVAVAVLKYGELAYAAGFGFSNRATRAPVDANTRFAIGSATKAFTSLAVSIYDDERKISLDTPLSQFFPDFKLLDPIATRDASLIDLLCHRTGVAPHNCLWYLGPFTRAQLLYRLRYLQPLAAFRGAYIYNNLMYMAAGQILEAVIGLSYEEIIQKRILDALGMTATTLSFSDFASNPKHALGYLLGNELPLKDFTNIGPAAEINSTANDMAKWVGLFLMNGLAGNGSIVLSQTAMNRLYQPFTDPGDGTKYGLGWNIGSATLATPSGPQQKRLVFHTGDPQGGSAYVSFMPDDGLGVVVMTNQHCTNDLIDKWPDKVATAIYDHLLNQKLTGLLALPKCSPGEYLSLSSAPPVPGPAPAFQAVNGVAALATAATADVTGMFSNSGYGDLVISRVGSNLQISYYGNSWQLMQIDSLKFVFRVPAFGTIFPVLVVFAQDPGTAAITALSAQLVLNPAPLMIPFIKR